MRKLIGLILILICGCGNDYQNTITVDPVSEHQIGGNWHCEASAALRVPREAMPTWSHTQGLAVTENYVIISSQVKQLGAILLKFNRSSDKFLQHRWLGHPKMDHPSDIQICERTLAVAVAVPRRDSFSIIYFCDVPTMNCVGDSIIIADHVGALAFGRYKKQYYLFGGTWDSDRLLIYRSEKRESDYELLAYENWIDLIAPGSTDSLKQKYNALHFYPRKADVPLLYASSGKVLDVWEVIGIANDELQLKKIYSKTTDGYIETGNGRLFHEGMDVHQIESRLFYFAAPHDFHADPTHTEFFLSPHYYVCYPAVD